MPNWNVPDVWCLSLYGNLTIVDATSSARLIQYLLGRFDLKPGTSFLKWVDSEKSSSPRWTKVASLADENEGRELEGLALEYKPTEADSDLSRLHQFDFNNRRRCTVFSVSKCVTRNGISDVLGVAEMLFQICRPSCGFITSISARQSAILYSAGIPYNPSTPEDRERQLEFQGALSRRHQDEAGYLGQFREKLRDVYPINFLTSGHLARTIDGLSLKAWVATRRYGRLTEMQQGVWTWELTDEEIAEARAELRKAGVLMVSQ